MELLCLVEIQTEKERQKTGFEFEGEFGPIRIFQFELTQSEVEYEYDMFALRYKPDSFTAPLQMLPVPLVDFQLIQLQE